MAQHSERRRRFLSFALLIWTGLLITEHFGASEPTGPLNPVLVLTYGPYYVVAAAILERTNDSRWRTLFIIGMLLGLATETFITRVLWTGWPGTDSPIVAGWAPVETLVLVPLWHPMMMIVSFVVCRSVFGIPSSIAPMTRRWTISFALIVPAIAGIFTDPGVVSPAFALIESLGLAFLWWLLWRSGGPVPLRLGGGAIAATAGVGVGAHVGFLLIGGPIGQGAAFPEPGQLIPALIVMGALIAVVVRLLSRARPAPSAPALVLPGVRTLLAYAVYATAVEGGLTLLRVVLGPLGELLRAAGYVSLLPLLALLLVRARRAAALTSRAEG